MILGCFGEFDELNSWDGHFHYTYFYLDAWLCPKTHKLPVVWLIQDGILGCFWALCMGTPINHCCCWVSSRIIYCQQLLKCRSVVGIKNSLHGHQVSWVDAQAASEQGCLCRWDCFSLPRLSRSFFCSLACASACQWLVPWSSGPVVMGGQHDAWDASVLQDDQSFSTRPQHLVLTDSFWWSLQSLSLRTQQPYFGSCEGLGPNNGLWPLYLGQGLHVGVRRPDQRQQGTARCTAASNATCRSTRAGNDACHNLQRIACWRKAVGCCSRRGMLALRSCSTMVMQSTPWILGRSAVWRLADDYFLFGSAANQEEGRTFGQKITQFQLHREQFVKQTDALLKMNPVYAARIVEIDRQLLTEWLGREDSAVPLPVLGCVITVAVGKDGPGESSLTTLGPFLAIMKHHVALN